MDDIWRFGGITMAIIALIGSVSSGKGATPPVPTLSYTAENQFTITNYDSTLVYELTSCSRSNNIVIPSSSTATITAKYSRALVSSSARTLLTAPYDRVLTSVAGGVSSEGCGPRPNLCCPSGTIQGMAGNQCGGAPGTQGSFAGCSGCTSGNPCYGLFITCWNWRWNNYSTGPEGTGYTLIGSTWGKAA